MENVKFYQVWIIMVWNDFNYHIIQHNHMHHAKLDYLSVIIFWDIVIIIKSSMSHIIRICYDLAFGFIIIIFYKIKNRLS